MSKIEIPDVPSCRFPGSGCFWNKETGPADLAEWLEFARQPLVLIYLWASLEQERILFETMPESEKLPKGNEYRYTQESRYFHLIRKGEVTEEVYLKEDGTRAICGYLAHYLQSMRNSILVFGREQLEQHTRNHRTLFWYFAPCRGQHSREYWHNHRGLTLEQVRAMLNPYWE